MNICSTHHRKKVDEAEYALFNAVSDAAERRRGFYHPAVDCLQCAGGPYAVGVRNAVDDGGAFDDVHDVFGMIVSVIPAVEALRYTSIESGVVRSRAWMNFSVGASDLAMPPITGPDMYMVDHVASWKDHNHKSLEEQRACGDYERRNVAPISYWDTR